jgi:hypothetical protein
MLKSAKTAALIVVLLSVICILAHGVTRLVEDPSSVFLPDIPRVWVDDEMASLEVPLADAASSPKHAPAEYYYRIPVRPIYKSYPVYAPGKEPIGYFESLKQLEPELVFDTSKLKTEEDWIKAGGVVFDAAVFYNAIVQTFQVRDPAWYEKTGTPVAKDGTLPFVHYVIREKGKVETATVSCAMCHTRVLADGTVVKGAQGNFPFELSAALNALTRANAERSRAFERAFFGAPWIRPDPLAGLDQMSADDIFQYHAAIPAGVIARQGTSPLSPAQIPDLIGVKERKYLDHTGLLIQRSIVDLMRYSALNQGGSDLASFGGFIPAARDFATLPDASTQGRYSDEQLYALALYIYSLTTPSNPNKFDSIAERGQQVFKREGCAVCHTPPLYTNNKLTPAAGFNVPDDHRKRFDVMSGSIGTDNYLAMKTRRGTGYYKVPSLKGLWYRGPFEHNGSVATLEDWFDPRRLSENYIPTGFRGAGVKCRAVKGHPFGLDLSVQDRRALIAFLKTL